MDSQIPYIRRKVPNLIDVNGRRVEADGIVLLNFTMPESDLIQNRVPFVVLSKEDKLIIGSNTLRARNLSLMNLDGEFKLVQYGKSKKIQDCNIDELNTNKQNLILQYDYHKPIEIVSNEELDIPEGATKIVNCQIGCKMRSNLDKLIVEVQQPYSHYVGYAKIKKKGSIDLIIHNNGTSKTIMKNSPIGLGYPIRDDDLTINPVPGIAEMSQQL